MAGRWLGIDIGAETIKLAEVRRGEHGLTWVHSALVEHHKDPRGALLRLLEGEDWGTVEGAAVTGRLSRQVDLPRIPEKQARASGHRQLHPEGVPVTLVSIGSHGFSVLELRGGQAPEVFRENSRCSQGTGNFLRQLVERFSLSVEEASALCARVDDPAPLSGRCPVILKTDMTHLANKGLDRSRILAGLYDAVAENAQVLLKPRLSPRRVCLLGGVSRSERIREHFRAFCDKSDMVLVDVDQDESLFTDALGCAALAAQQSMRPPAVDRLLAAEFEASLDLLPPLSQSLDQVKRMPKQGFPADEGERLLIVGLDIGSTGSKAVAVDADTMRPVWQGYTATNGQPVEAARSLVSDFAATTWARHPVVAIGATGSGREIVGSLLHTCYGAEPVFVLNEIAAHARGALHYDPRVDTIFEIGGQDAKYIRLANGRVVDAAMNEACSAGTGSFIEEQGKRFQGIDDVVQMGEVAVGASCGVSLGQHCSVFMAEIIDEAVGAGLEQPTIVAGIYDSIIQNYLNRVKGSRSVGSVIFCQGMPFSSDALAAAVARQTGAEVIVPPEPGTIGALGIALLTAAEGKGVLDDVSNLGLGLDLERFMSARVLTRDHFTCKSTRGCGGSGNKCRIDRLTTLVEGEKQKFTWGGSCSLYDKGTGKVKLPDGAPDPFREREEYVAAMLEDLGTTRGSPTIALTDEFALKGLFPFFATFVHALGYDLAVFRGADGAVLKRGIEEANVPFCAPMQQYHGLASIMAESDASRILLPMLRNLPKLGDERHSKLCPIVQASADMLSWDLPEGDRDRILSPIFDVDEGGLRSVAFKRSCARMAGELGAPGWEDAWRRGLEAQERFQAFCVDLGSTALEFALQRGITPVVVLGRPYTIYNRVLNSNVPAILREQGAMAIPVDCYAVDDGVPIFDDVYWGYGQRSLRAAHQVRRSPGVYSMWCSNYSCGPDSFNLHFYAYMMEGKPWAVIETDGHSGDAGTRTRVEAFLYCVKEDQIGSREDTGEYNSLVEVASDRANIHDIRERREIVLFPRMGPGAEAVAAALRGVGMRAEALPQPSRYSLGLGRRHTSGKECVPMTVTLGSLLDRLEGEEDSDDRFAFFMPTASGPCRFGVYNVLHKITLERLGWSDRVRVWSPRDTGYFDGLPGGFTALIFTAFMAADLLQEMRYDVRPVERRLGATKEIHARYEAELHALLETVGSGDLSNASALLQVATGRLFGVADVLKRAARDFAAVKEERPVPTVLMVGEIYVRCDPFSNDFAVERLEERGIRVRFAPFNEWVEYVDWLNSWRQSRTMGEGISSIVQSQIQSRTYNLVAGILGWPPRTEVPATVEAAAPWVRRELEGEAVLTVGGPVHEYREGLIDGVLNVGPLECMPSKISEAQFFHVAEEEGLVSLTVPLNGDPVDPEVWDNFAYEVKAAYERRGERPTNQGHRPGRGLFGMGALLGKGRASTRH